jgi:hypothetical protein
MTSIWLSRDVGFALQFPDVCFQSDGGQRHRQDECGENSNPRFHVRTQVDEAVDADESDETEYKLGHRRLGLVGGVRSSGC